MRKLLIVVHILLTALILLNPWTSWGAVYYVNCDAADDTLNGMSTDNAWKTVAKVNGETFSAGDNVLFNKGCTWREQLTVPSSGSAGNPITFGAYGSGAAPVITGADLVTTWTASEGTPSTALSTDANTVALWQFNQNLNDNSTNGYNLTDAATMTYGNTGNPYDYYGIFDGSTDYATYTDTGDYFDVMPVTMEVTFACDNDAPTTQYLSRKRSAAYIGYGIRIYKFSNTQYYASCWAQGSGGGGDKWLNDDTYGHVCQSGGTTWHTVACVWDNTANMEIYVDGVARGTMDISAVGSLANDGLITIGADAGGASKFKGNIEEVRISNIKRTSFVAPAAAVAGQDNTWQAAVTTQPYTVIFDNTWGGRPVANLAAVNSANKWFWVDNVLSIYATSDPDAAYVAPGIQVGKRDHAIQSTWKDYITIDGIEAQSGNHPNNGTIQYDFESGGVGYTPVVKNSTIRYASGDGILISGYPTLSTVTNALLDNITVVNSGRYGLDFNKVNAAAGNENIMINNDITNWWLTGILVEGSWAIIERNTVHDGGDVTQVGGGVQLYSAGIGAGTGDNNIVRYNLIRDVRGHLYDGYGIDVDQWCDNNVVAYNLVYNIDGPGIYHYDTLDGSILNNIVYNSNIDTAGDGLQRGGIRLTGSRTDGSIIKNNICYLTSSGSYPVYVSDGAEAGSHTITNNVWYRPSGNWYFYDGTGGDTLATWNALTGVGTDLNTDPLFVSTVTPDFSLQAGSPAINAGVDVGLTEDYLGNGLYGAAWDMGAYEYQAGVDSTPEAFTFTDVTEVALSTVKTSNTITVTGIDIAADLTITGGTYSKNGAAYTATAGTVVADDNVSVRVTSSHANLTDNNVVLTIGGVSDTYTVTTLAYTSGGGGGFPSFPSFLSFGRLGGGVASATDNQWNGLTFYAPFDTVADPLRLLRGVGTLSSIDSRTVYNWLKRSDPIIDGAGWTLVGTCTHDGNIYHFPAVNDRMQQLVGGTPTTGETYRFWAEMSGSGTISIRFSGDVKVILLDNTTRMYFVDSVGDPTGGYAYVKRETGNTATDVTITKLQVDEITGVNNPNPFDYVATLTAYDNDVLTGTYTADRRISCWGDSLTAGISAGTRFPEQLAVNVKYPTYNGGVSAENSYQIKGRFDAATLKHADITVIWAGQNGYNGDPGTTADNTIRGNIQAMVNTLVAAGNSRYVVMTIPGASTDNVGSSNYNKLVAVNNGLMADHPGHYIDIRTVLVDSYDPTIAQDVLDHDNNVTPSSLRWPADTVHLNAAGSRIVADQLSSFFSSNNYNAVATLKPVPVTYDAMPLDNTYGVLAMEWLPTYDSDMTTGAAYYLFDAGGLEAYYNATDQKIYLTDGTNTISTDALTFSANVAQKLAFRWGASGLLVYRDGSQAATGATFTEPALNANLYIGTDTSSANAAYSNFKPVRTWNREFTATEMAAITQ